MGNLELRLTAELMKSSDYKERFAAEYWQTKIRYEKLKRYNNQIEASKYSMKVLEPPHDCPDHLLREQQRAMGEYLHILEIRAVIEGVNLEDTLHNLKAKEMCGCVPTNMPNELADFDATVHPE